MLPSTLVATSVDRNDLGFLEGFRVQLDRLLSGELAARLHFQPIVDLERGVPAGYEALARFPAELGTAPDVCFAAATQLGRRLALEDLTCGMALQARERLPRNCFLSINMGPEYLLSEECQRLFTAQGNLAGCVFEITEETAIGDYAAVRERLAQVRDLGGSVAVDDVGAGYASLNHILEIKPEFIKLDRRFVQNCHLDRAKTTLIEMMGAAAGRLDAWIVAEGVEILAELEELLSLDVPLAQGYLLGRPAFDMPSMDPVAAEILRSRTATPPQGELDLRSSVVAVQSCSGVEGAAALLRADHGRALAVVVDQWQRPVRVVQQHPLLGLRPLPSFMRVQLESAPADVLERALSRELAVRFDPLIVIGEEGALLGIVEIDRLAGALLSSSLGRG